MQEINFLNWVFRLPVELAKFSNWLLTPLEVINMSPLAILSVGGISLIIGVHIVRLFV